MASISAEEYSQTIELKFPTSHFFATRTKRQMENLCEDLNLSSLEISGHTLTLEGDEENLSIAEEILKLKLYCSTKIIIPVQHNVGRTIAKLKKERNNIQCQFGYLGIDDIHKKTEEKVQGISATLVGVFKKDFEKAKNKMIQVCDLPKDVIHMTTAKYQRLFPSSQDQKSFEVQNDVDLFYNRKNSLYITATYQKNLDTAKKLIFKKLDEFKKEN